MERKVSNTRMIAIDMDGTLLGDTGQVSPRNLAALRAAQSAGVEVVVATGRRHSFAMRVLRSLALPHASALVSSNGTVTRTLGYSDPAAPIASQLIARNHLPLETARWLCSHLGEYRNALVLTFDRVGPDGDDTRGALVVERLDQLTASISRWMEINSPYIARVVPIELALESSESAGSSLSNAPIQAMLCGTIDRMRAAEARLLEHPGVIASGHPSGRSAVIASGHTPTPQSLGAPFIPPRGMGESDAEPILALHRTDYPARNLSILDILPAGCSKGAAILSLAASRGIAASEILAIGDNWNDVSMLDAAGSAVLMDNAPGDLKQLARERGWRIGPSNLDDGVAAAIESALGVVA